jgi:hypothetical protein
MHSNRDVTIGEHILGWALGNLTVTISVIRIINSPIHQVPGAFIGSFFLVVSHLLDKTTFDLHSLVWYAGSDPPGNGFV